MKPVIFIIRCGSIQHEVSFMRRLQSALEAVGFRLAVVSDVCAGVQHTDAWFLGLFIERFKEYSLGLSDIAVACPHNGSAYAAREVLCCGGVKQALQHEGMYWCRLIYDDLLKSLNPSCVLLWNGQHGSEMMIRDLLLARCIPHWIVARGRLPGTWHLDKEGATALSAAARRRDVGWYPERSWVSAFDRYAETYRAGTMSWHRQPQHSDVLGSGWRHTEKRRSFGCRSLIMTRQTSSMPHFMRPILRRSGGSATKRARRNKCIKS
jgi:hypothetical protein